MCQSCFCIWFSVQNLGLLHIQSKLFLTTLCAEPKAVKGNVPVPHQCIGLCGLMFELSGARFTETLCFVWGNCSANNVLYLYFPVI